MRTRAELEGLADRYEAKVEALGARITEALMQGDDAGAAETQREQAEARDRAQQFRRAAEAAAAIEAEDLRRKQRDMNAKAVVEAEEACNRLAEAAGNLDAAICALDKAWSDVELAKLDALRALRRAGAADTRIANTLPAAARWALAANANPFAEAVGAPRTPANRRRLFRESVTAMLPPLPEAA